MYKPTDIIVSSVQFNIGCPRTESQFHSKVESFIKLAAERHSEYVLFPELFTFSIFSKSLKKVSAKKSIELLTDFKDRFIAFVGKCASEYNVNVIAGSHLQKTEDGSVKNVSYIFLKTGSVLIQEKLHPTPDEKELWGVEGGNKLEIINKNTTPAGVLICYDSEFPELSRFLIEKGALIIFVPFCTEDRQGFCRVLYSCQALAVQNQCYVVLSGTIGKLKNTVNMGANYAKSCILSPCAQGFPKNGIMTSSYANRETLITAKLNMKSLLSFREHGAVQNLKDRRSDLYEIKWSF